MSSPPGFASSAEHLRAELDRLDVLLAALAAAAPGDPLPEPVVDDLAARRAGIDDRVATSAEDGVSLRLVALTSMFGLDALDRDLFVACLAPALEQRHLRVYRHLGIDPLTAGALLDMLGAGPAALLRLGPGAPLVRHALLRLGDPGADGAGGSSLLGRTVRPAERVVRFMLGDDAVAEPLRAVTRLRHTDDGGPAVPAALRERLDGLAAAAPDRLLLHLQGDGGGPDVAAACCARWDLDLLVVRGSLLGGVDTGEFGRMLTLLDREARLQGATLCWTDVDTVLDDAHRAHRELLLATLAAYPAPTFVAGRTAWEPPETPDGVLFARLELPEPTAAERAATWSSVLGDGADAAVVAGVADAFRLPDDTIAAAAATARGQAFLRSPEAPTVTGEDLHAAARLHSGRRLGEVARRVVLRHGWDDLVLPPDRMAQVREIHDRIRHRATVHESWGFGATLSGRGLGVLFAGPSGTGKTMTAGVLARELGLDLYAVDLSAVLSKYIGETEKNLGRIFDEAATSDAILFFDEADALFATRTRIADAHDRYANVETSYLLQRVDDHDGVVVLASNLRSNIDDAFVRRLAFTVEFPAPGPDERRRIWERIWPAGVPLDAGVDPDVLAHRFEVPGGNLRNIALAGAFLAAADGTAVTMDHLQRAANREYRKMGKIEPAGWDGGE